MVRINLTGEKKGFVDFFYLMTVGVLFAWTFVAGIVDTTVFERDHVIGLMRMFFVVGILGLIFSHKYIRRVGIGVFVLGALFVASGFIFTQDEPTLANHRFAQLILMSIDYIFGNRPHTMAYEMLIKWMISLFFGLFVVVFSYYKFHFWVLFSVSVVTISLAITSPYFVQTQIFYVYVFCLLALVLKYLYRTSMKKIVNPPRSSKIVYLMIPLIAGVVILAGFIPKPPEGSSEGFMNQVVSAPFDWINELFLNATTPSEFSLRQIGFGGNGRLGGDVVPNDGVFMRISTTVGRTRMPLYLTGATSDTYTGYSWVNLHHNYQSVDFDAFEQNIEFFEAAIASEFMWHFSTLEGIDLGRLVQIDLYEWLGIDEENQAEFGIESHWRVFMDETTERVVWAEADHTEHDHTEHGGVDLSESFHSLMSEMVVDSLESRLTTLFHAGVLLEMSFPDESLPLLRSRDGRVLAEQRLGSDMTYSVHFIDFSLVREAFGEGNIVEGSHSGILRHVSEGMADFRQTHGYNLALLAHQLDFNGTVISFEDLLNHYLIPRADEIYEIYTVLPDTFPERIGALALEVTKEATSDYGRMRMLEQFLSENFAYTLTPGSSPIDQDFVDHFLFELQRGYCVHFASAFVTMARSLGLPARYVEGFLVNASSSDGRAGEIDVLNNMAHAWPEVYFEGYGWHRFEPTPSSGLPQLSDGTSGSDGSGIEQDSGEERPAWASENPPSSEDLELPTTESQNVGQQQGTSVNPGEIDATGDYRLNFSLWEWTGIVILCVMILGFIRVIFVHLGQSRMSKKQTNEAVIDQFKILLIYLTCLGFEIRENETSIQFATRIKRYFSELEYERSLLTSAAEIFAKARYSQQEITVRECQMLAKLIRRMDDRVQDQLGKWKYFIYRYILAKF